MGKTSVGKTVEIQIFKKAKILISSHCDDESNPRFGKHGPDEDEETKRFRAVPRNDDAEETPTPRREAPSVRLCRRINH